MLTIAVSYTLYSIYFLLWTAYYKIDHYLNHQHAAGFSNAVRISQYRLEEIATLGKNHQLPRGLCTMQSTTRLNTSDLTYGCPYAIYIYITYIQY